jgi:hypothetical protein
VDGGYRGGRGGRRWEQGWAVAQWCSEVTTALPRPWVADGGADGSERGKAGEERAEEDAGGTGDARCDGDKAVKARLKKDDGSCACPNGHVLGRPNHICRFLPYVAMEAPNSRLTHLRAR